MDNAHASRLTINCPLSTVQKLRPQGYPKIPDFSPTEKKGKPTVLTVARKLKDVNGTS
jgi:hypothetical protein